MNQSKWPFAPQTLCELIEPETLSVIEAGCRERLGREMTIIDDITGDHTTNTRTDPINPEKWMGSFCELLRNERRVRGGDEACRQCDMRMVREFIDNENVDGRIFRCHMGLVDAAQPIKVQGQIVAVILSGQYAPHNNNARKQIDINVDALGQGRYSHIIPLDEVVKSELKKRAEKLDRIPDDFVTRLAKEAQHIERIAESEFSHIKRMLEQDFHDSLRRFDGFTAAERMEQIQRATCELLRRVQQFCGCEYLVFFANVLENESVLTAISTVGLSQSIQNRMPHYNWKKGGLPENVADLRNWDFQTHHNESLEGIRGDNSHFFEQVSCIIPTTIGEFYRSVLVFGPFENRVNLRQEKGFLSEVARILGWLVLVKLQYLSLQQERERHKSTQELLIHQLRTGITPVATQIKTAYLMLQRPLTSETIKLIKDWLVSAHHISLNLGKSAGETVRSHVLHLEKSDLNFGSYPLSVLVANCVDAYSREAKKKQRELILDESIEWLPNAEIDLARLTIALGNLLDNAIKYSFAGTTIYVRAAARTGILVSNLDTKSATIEIEDLGFEVPLDEKNLIFQKGRRGIIMARMGRIPGTGLGLWETRSVVEAHGGEIDVRSEAVPTRLGQREAYKVTFNIRIPLQQPKS